MSADAAGSGRQTKQGEGLERLTARPSLWEDSLRLLYLLAEGERSVSELETLLGLRQPAISQQLARLLADGLVRYRRNGKWSRN